MQQARPDFLCIGAAKAGTTWLWAQLRKHPSIWLPPAKEIHYFDRSRAYPSPNRLATASFKSRLLQPKDDEISQIIKGSAASLYNIAKLHFKRAAWWGHWTYGQYNDDWYVRLFSNARADQVCGEATPAYSILDLGDIENIRTINPNMRLIYLIRDPIERAWSGIRYSSARNNLEITAERLDTILERLRSPLMRLRGDYERTLDNYLRVFDSSQVLVCFYDAISKDPVNLMQCITNFLGLPDLKTDLIDSATRVNSSPPREIPDIVKQHLIEEYQPMIVRLSRRFGSYSADWEERYNNGSERIRLLSEERVPGMHPEPNGAGNR